MATFKLTEALIEQIQGLIEAQQGDTLVALFEEYHFADIAEIIDELSVEEATYLIKLLDS